MEKAAQRKSYRDPALNKIVQEKARWNREVSTLINDIIHFKKSMNGWPSKYYKERTRITQPAPIDLTGILGGLATKFQDLANEGNGIIQEQTEFARSRVKRQSERAQQKLEQTHGPAEGPAPTPAAPKPDLTQQIQKGLAASEEDSPLVKLAAELEDKYSLESLASNPFSRFITRLFTPKIGFGEGARIRRLRMTMLDSCVKSYKELKRLQKEIIKSSNVSITNAHKISALVSDHWTVVFRLYSNYKALRPGDVKEQGGPLEDTELKREKAIEEGREPDEATEQPDVADTQRAAKLFELAKDYRKYGAQINSKSQSFQALHSIIESVVLAPKDQKVQVLLDSSIDDAYQRAVADVNKEFNTSGSSFEQIFSQISKDPLKNKQAQKWLGKLRHQLLPGDTSGSRLEVYNFITKIKTDLNLVMDLLEQGFDMKGLTPAIGQVQRDMTMLRTMMRSVYRAQEPGKSPQPFF